MTFLRKIIGKMKLVYLGEQSVTRRSQADGEWQPGYSNNLKMKIVSTGSTDEIEKTLNVSM